MLREEKYDGVDTRNVQGNVELFAELEAKSGPPETCTGCLNEDKDRQFFRCVDCLDDIPVCARCILVAHGSKPFHSIEEWQGIYWKATTLTAMGYIYQRGHDGRECPNPAEAEKRILRGRELWVRDCRCEEEPHLQEKKWAEKMAKRQAQCVQAYWDLQFVVRVRAELIRLRNSNCVGAVANARAGKRIAKQSERILQAQRVYDAAKEALRELGLEFYP
ncbi:hypothetical protein B0H13DRAFT_2314582 [Mycena leptocephala]|nr:hypothetical protein B0H13DRAFT_2314582 [Mycena leptocephala]